MKNSKFGRFVGYLASPRPLSSFFETARKHSSQMISAIIATVLAALALPADVCASDAILLDFTSSHCAPCRAMEPVIAQLEQSGIPVRRVDVRAEPRFAARYGVRQTPTFIVLKGGKEVTRLIGMHSAQELRQALAINPAGPLIPTRAELGDGPVNAPPSRLAPVRQGAGQLPAAQTATAQLSEPMPSVNRAAAVERAKAATVRLRVYDGKGFGAGTGTIIDTHGSEALVLTCGHLFRETKGQGKIEVDLFVGGQTKTVSGQVIDYDADHHDIALVVIRPEIAIQPVTIMATGLANGQSVFSFGCDRGADPSRRDTRITGINKYNQDQGESNIEIAGAPIDGRSGGGLFDSAGRLIGVCNAADYQSDVGIYTGPGSIRWQLDRVNLARLYNNPASSAAAIAAVPSAAPVTSQASGPASSQASGPAPNVQLAGLQEAAPALDQLVPQAAPAAGAGNFAGQEVIVIVRDRNNPTGSAQVMNLQPSAELMQTLQRHSR